MITVGMDGFYPEVYVCRHLRQPWPELWKTCQYYG